MPTRVAVDVEPAVDRDRHVVLRRLVVLRHVGIEVVLAREHRLRRHLQVQRLGDPQRVLDRLLVEHRQRSRQAQAHGADVRVRLVAELVGAPAEQLARGRQLAVHFQPDDDFVVTHEQEPRQRGARPESVPNPPRRGAQRRDARVRPRRRRAARRSCSSTGTPRPSASGGATSSPLAARRLRGDRARPPRPRRFEPRTRQLLRHRRVRDGLLRPRPRRARSRAVRGRGRRRRRRRALRHRLALSRFVTKQVFFNTVPPPLNDVYDGRRHPTRRRPRPARAGRLLRAPGATIPTACSPSSTRPTTGSATSRACTAIGSGERRTRSRRRRAVPHRALRATPTSCARAGACTNRPPAIARWKTCPACSRRRRSRRWCCTDPRTTW